MNVVPGEILLKCVVVGYGSVGKTSALITFETGVFPSDYCPSVADAVTASSQFDGKPYRLGLWDTGGGEDYDRLRPLSYPQTDVFLLLFDVSSRESSIEGIHSYWCPELRHFCPGVPIVLVGSKIDKRHEEIRTATTEEGEALARKIKAAKYMEISSLENNGITELFDQVGKIGFEYNITATANQKKKKKCRIL